MARRSTGRTIAHQIRTESMGSGTITCGVTDVYSTVVGLCEESKARTEQKMRRDIRAAADSAVAELEGYKGNYVVGTLHPVGHSTGDYAKGWRAYHHATVEGHAKSVVANAAKPSLTHLLEFGHTMFIFGHNTHRHGGQHKHIAQAYEHAAAKLRRSLGN